MSSGLRVAKRTPNESPGDSGGHPAFAPTLNSITATYHRSRGKVRKAFVGSVLVWSAVTCHRFGPRRPDAALRETRLLSHIAATGRRGQSADRSAHSKLVHDAFVSGETKPSLYVLPPLQQVALAGSRPARRLRTRPATGQACDCCDSRI